MDTSPRRAVIVTLDEKEVNGVPTRLLPMIWSPVPFKSPVDYASTTVFCAVVARYVRSNAE